MRVPEGFTCDCFDGYRLDMTRMACVGEGWPGVPGAGRGLVTAGAGPAQEVQPDLRESRAWPRCPLGPKQVEGRILQV